MKKLRAQCLGLTHDLLGSKRLGSPSSLLCHPQQYASPFRLGYGGQSLDGLGRCVVPRVEGSSCSNCSNTLPWRNMEGRTVAVSQATGCTPSFGTPKDPSIIHNFFANDGIKLKTLLSGKEGSLGVFLACVLGTCKEILGFRHSGASGMDSRLPSNSSIGYDRPSFRGTVSPARK